MSLVGFGVKNLRCLTDTGIVPIKPITLLVGKNSSGKSTFLRAFPLLRQSVESARSSPILWHHKDYVDFGSFDVAVNERAADPSITFSFAVELPEHERVGVGEPSCELSMTLARGDRGTRISSYDVHIAERTIHMEFEASHRVKGITLDGKPVALEKDLWLSGPASLIPTLDDVAGQKATYPAYTGFAPNANLVKDTVLSRALRDKLATTYGLNEEPSDFLLSLPVGSSGDMIEKLISFLKFNGVDATSVDPKSDVLRSFVDLIVMARLPDILTALDRQVSHYMYRVAYLGPRRAVGTRFHRLDEVAVSEIHPRSENLASFLASLSEPEMRELADFTRRHLGFEPAIRIEGLNAEILVKERHSATYKNIADVGSGYAELLPLCAAVWLNLGETGAGRPLTSLIALEQPELHMHPAYQPKLARMIVGAREESRRAGYDAAVLVETHSDAVVNQLGLLIRAGRVSSEDVQILLFDQDPSTRETKVVVTGYQPDGVLRENWPFGFLIGALDELDDIEDAAAEE
ncbi:MAG: AAA family ATPase [Minicystis sp.]